MAEGFYKIDHGYFPPLGQQNIGTVGNFQSLLSGARYTSAFTHLTGIGIDYAPDPNFDPAPYSSTLVKINPLYEEHIGDFNETESLNEFKALRRRVDNEYDLLHKMSENPVFGFLGGFLGGVADPTVLAPGAFGFKAGKVIYNLKDAAEVGKAVRYGMAGGALAGGAYTLEHSQIRETYHWSEPILEIPFGALVGAGFGRLAQGSFARVNKQSRIALAKAVKSGRPDLDDISVEALANSMVSGKQKMVRVDDSGEVIGETETQTFTNIIDDMRENTKQVGAKPARFSWEETDNGVNPVWLLRDGESGEIAGQITRAGYVNKKGSQTVFYVQQGDGDLVEFSTLKKAQNALIAARKKGVRVTKETPGATQKDVDQVRSEQSLADEAEVEADIATIKPLTYEVELMGDRGPVSKRFTLSPEVQYLFAKGHIDPLYLNIRNYQDFANLVTRLERFDRLHKGRLPGKPKGLYKRNIKTNVDELKNVLGDLRRNRVVQTTNRPVIIGKLGDKWLSKANEWAALGWLRGPQSFATSPIKVHGDTVHAIFAGTTQSTAETFNRDLKASIIGMRNRGLNEYDAFMREFRKEAKAAGIKFDRFWRGTDPKFTAHIYTYTIFGGKENRGVSVSDGLRNQGYDEQYITLVAKAGNFQKEFYKKYADILNEEGLLQSDTNPNAIHDGDFVPLMFNPRAALAQPKILKDRMTEDYFNQFQEEFNDRINQKVLAKENMQNQVGEATVGASGRAGSLLEEALGRVDEGPKDDGFYVLRNRPDEYEGSFRGREVNRELSGWAEQFNRVWWAPADTASREGIPEKGKARGQFNLNWVQDSDGWDVLIENVEKIRDDIELNGYQDKVGLFYRAGVVRNDEVASWIHRIRQALNENTSEESAARQILESFRGRLPVRLDPTGADIGAAGSFAHGSSTLALSGLPGLSSPQSKTLVHELAHFLSQEMLTMADRVEFMKLAKGYYTDPKNLEHIKTLTRDDGSYYPLHNVHEIFVDNFVKWYYGENPEIGNPTFWKKVVRYVQKMYDYFMKKNTTDFDDFFNRVFKQATEEIPESGYVTRMDEGAFDTILDRMMDRLNQEKSKSGFNTLNVLKEFRKVLPGIPNQPIIQDLQPEVPHRSSQIYSALNKYLRNEIDEEAVRKELKNFARHVTPNSKEQIQRWWDLAMDEEDLIARASKNASVDPKTGNYVTTPIIGGRPRNLWEATSYREFTEILDENVNRMFHGELELVGVDPEDPDVKPFKSWQKHYKDNFDLLETRSRGLEGLGLSKSARAHTLAKHFESEFGERAAKWYDDNEILDRIANGDPTRQLDTQVGIRGMATEASNQMFNKIIGKHLITQTPYDKAVANWSRSLRKRQFPHNPEFYLEFINTNPSAIAYTYLHRISSDIEINRFSHRFIGIPGAGEDLSGYSNGMAVVRYVDRQGREDIARLKRDFPTEYGSDEAQLKLQKLHDSFIQQLQAVFERLQARRGAPDDEWNLGHRLSVAMMILNYTTRLGKIVLTTIPEAGRISALGTMGDYSQAFALNLKELGKSLDQSPERLRARELGTAIETTLQQYHLGGAPTDNVWDVNMAQNLGSLAREVGTNPVSATANYIETGLYWLNTKAGLITGQDPIDDFLRSVSATMVEISVPKDIEALATGKASATLREHFLRYGISEDHAKEFYAEMLKPGHMVELPNAYGGGTNRRINWDRWQDGELKDNLRAFMLNAIDNTVLRPNADLPPWVDMGPLTRLLTQFKQHPFSANQRVLAAVLNGSPSAYLNPTERYFRGVTFAVFLGMLSFYLKAIVSGEASRTRVENMEPIEFMWQGYIRSGIGGILGDVADLGFGIVDPANRKYPGQSVVNTILGPTSSRVPEIQGMINGARTGDWDKFRSEGRNWVPFQNHIGWHLLEQMLGKR
jgi:hypothetical protein